MNGILKKLGIAELGLFELLFAAYPILSGYQYGFIRLDLLVLIILDIIALRRPRTTFGFTPLTIFCCYVIMHDVVWLIVTGGSSYQVNTIISNLILFFSIFIIVPAINNDKLKSGIQLVGVVAVLGLLYHLMVILSGGSVSPIKLPFFPDLGESSRFADVYENRPCSFFPEPSGLATYLLVPLFIYLKEKKFIYVACYIIAILLTTSTNGLVGCCVMILIFLFSEKQKLSVYVVTATIVAVASHLYLNNSLFEVGREKAENTEFEESSRLYNGPEIVSHMPVAHMALGMPYHTIEEYYESGSLSDASLLYSHRGFVFVPAIYLMFIKYGILGFMLFLCLYYSIYKKSRDSLPYLIVVVVGMISSSTLLNSGWIFQIMFLLSFIEYDDISCDSLVLP